MLRDIRITPALNGFMVQCGCQTLVYTDINSLIGDLQSYLQTPEVVEKRILASACNRKHTMGESPIESIPPPPCSEPSQTECGAMTGQMPTLVR